MVWNIIKGLVLGLLLFIALSYVWYRLNSTHVRRLNVKDCNVAPASALKELSEFVKDSWFQREHYEVTAYSDGSCVFFTFYQKPGALYFGQQTTSGHMIGVAMTTNELHEFADTISSGTNFQQMLDYLSERAKRHPAPKHEFEE